MRMLRFMALLVAMVLVLAACSGAEVVEGDAAGDGDITDPGTDTGADPDTDTADAGDEEPPPAGDGEVIRIGSIHPLTGGLALDGGQMDNAIRMAIDQINADGGIASLGGAQLQIISADSQGDPGIGQTEAQRMIDEGAVALIGTFQSAVTINVAALAERSQVPLVIDVAVADEIIDEGSEYTFRIQPNSSAMGVSAAQYLAQFAEDADEDISTIAYLYQEDAFGTSVFNAFRDEAENLGLEIVESIAYNAFEVSGLSTEMARINASGADVLVNTGYYNDGVLVARDAGTIQPDVKVIMGVAQGAFDQPQFPQDVPGSSDLILGSNYHFDATKQRVIDLREEFQAEFGEEMRTSAVFAYQAVELIADALERAGVADPVAVRDALAETDFDDPLLAFDGPIRFDESGENENAIPIVIQVQDGAPVQVWPEAFAEADLVFPGVPWATAE